ncbi:MAG TPA: FtsX-like permease family protein [bacterium]|nr:FtsX-like permease family protein [bacterium]
MAQLWIFIKEFLQDIRMHRLRAFLTTVAITWGTLAVILLMAFGEGLAFRMQEGLLNAANRIIVIWGGQTTIRHEGLSIGRRVRFVKEDAELLERSIPQIAVAVPGQGSHVRLRNGDRIASTYMEGVHPEFEFMRRLYPAAGGRFLNEKDMRERRRVVFLGSIIASELFGNADPVGRTVHIENMPFTIVGIMPKKLQTSMNNGPDDRRAIIPFSTFQTIYGWKHVGSISIQPVRDEDGPFIEKEIRRVLGNKFKFDPEDNGAIYLANYNTFLEQGEKVFKGINIFLAVIGAMSLIIAGVGVANIMYVVARERTPEIGIKRAVGAKRRHILFQFIFESLLIAFTGGAFGILLSAGIIKLMWSIPAQAGAMEFLGRPVMSNDVVVVAVGVLTLIGLLAGLFPARKAAAVDPIEALRYE